MTFFATTKHFLHVFRINSFNILANHFKESRWKNIPQYIKFFQAWICNYLKQSDGFVENKVFQWLAIQPRIYFYLFQISILKMGIFFCWLSRNLEKVEIFPFLKSSDQIWYCKSKNIVFLFFRFFISLFSLPWI